MGTGSFRGKAAGSWRWPPTTSSAEVKEKVRLYLCSPLGLRGLFWGDLYLYLTLTVSYISPIITTYNAYVLVDSNSRISVTIQSCTRVHTNFRSHSDRCYHLPQYRSFLLNYPVFIRTFFLVTAHFTTQCFGKHVSEVTYGVVCRDNA